MPIILTVNAGSSSIRLQAIRMGAGEPERPSEFHGERGGSGGPAARERLAAVLSGWRLEQPAAVAHRIVHGGPLLTRPVLITPEVEREVERLSSVAPLHNPPALEWIRA